MFNHKALPTLTVRIISRVTLLCEARRCNKKQGPRARVVAQPYTLQGNAERATVELVEAEARGEPRSLAAYRTERRRDAREHGHSRVGDAGLFPAKR